MIAAGGLSTLYFHKTDTMGGNTGDPYAVVARAVADLVNMDGGAITAVLPDIAAVL